MGKKPVSQKDEHFGSYVLVAFAVGLKKFLDFGDEFVMLRGMRREARKFRIHHHHLLVMEVNGGVFDQLTDHRQKVAGSGFKNIDQMIGNFKKF